MSDHSALVVLACALVTLAGILVAAAAGYLARRDGASYPTALARAATAFAATLTLTAALAAALTDVAQR